ncbi:hypothetical protein WR25_12825 [Diploscapter pachys]|uniref:glucuronosyltransferase n=1 Tax=Diploscapter pachys TaxID=2018661 RepID=A0A2A2JB19_9BILA|nr:hypothetical protein WR25_12825 [Diploscapter pachys]
MPLLEVKNGNKTGVTLVKKVILYPGDERSVELTNKFGGTQEESGEFNIWKLTPAFSSMIGMLDMMSDIVKFQCQKMMNDKELLDKLRAEEFDLGIAEPLGICQFVLFDELQIPATIAAESTAPMPLISRIIGEPQLVSNVPGVFSEFGDKMTLAQRTINLAGSLFGFYFANFIFAKELDSIESVVGKKEYAELISKTSYVFVNSHPYLDFPFPALPKTVLIGGITVSPKSKNSELSEKWQEILSRRSKNVLISFGSNVRSMDMPEEYRQSFFQMFESMPDTTFIWKFEKKNATIADAYDNVPVMGDQKRNAEMLLRHEVALPLQKEDLENANKLINTVREVINNDKYRKKAERLAEILKSRPTSSKDMDERHVHLAQGSTLEDACSADLSECRSVCDVMFGLEKPLSGEDYDDTDQSENENSEEGEAYESSKGPFGNDGMSESIDIEQE